MNKQQKTIVFVVSAVSLIAGALVLAYFIRKKKKEDTAGKLPIQEKPSGDWAMFPTNAPFGTAYPPYDEYKYKGSFVYNGYKWTATPQNSGVIYIPGHDRISLSYDGPI